MNIERTHGYYDGSVMPQEPHKPVRARQDGQEAKKVPGETETVADSTFQALTLQAASTPDINAQAVAEAKRLLQSGELSSPEAIRRAAKAMLSRGI
jgi:hypothetical protein